MKQAKLVLQSQDGQTTQEVPFSKPSLTIGRKPGNDLHFNRAEISGNHAAFTMENNQFYISDLGSTNGTLLNGAQLVAREKYTLQHGDVITITPFRITFLLESTTSETMIEAPPPKPQPQRKGSGTEPDLAARLGTGTEEQNKEAYGLTSPPPPPAGPVAKKPDKEAPAPPPEPAPKVATESKEPTPAPAPAGAPMVETPAVAPPQTVQPAVAEALPQIPPKKSSMPDFVWLGIGALFVIAAIGLIMLLFMML